MIEHLSGSLFKKSIGHVIVDCGGVGYGVSIPLSTFEALPAEGEPVALWIWHHQVEGESTLYGFAQPEGREIFGILLSVSGIGPKLALKMLSTMSIDAFAGAIGSGNVGALTSIPGIGKKTAERLILELKDKLARRGRSLAEAEFATAAGAMGQGQIAEEAVEALVALGESPTSARQIVTKVLADLPDDASLEVIIRACLKKQK